MTKLILWCAYNLTRYLSCSIFFRNGWLHLSPTCALDRLFFLEVLATVVALFWQQGKGGEWQVIWCLSRPQIIHDFGYFCISIMWLFNFFLVKRTFKQELQVPKGTRGNLTNMPSSTTRLSSTIPYLLFPSISYSSSSSSFFSSSSSSCSSSLRRFHKPRDPPPSPAGTCKTGTGFSPRFQNIDSFFFKLYTSYKIVTVITRLLFSDLCSPDRT